MCVLTVLSLQEYKPEFHDISKKKREEVATSGSITLKKISTEKYREEFADTVMHRHVACKS